MRRFLSLLATFANLTAFCRRNCGRLVLDQRAVRAGATLCAFSFRISSCTRLPDPTSSQLHYLWVFIVAFLDLLIYSIIAIYLAWHRRDLSQQHVNGQAAKVWRVMMLFPLSYIITMCATRLIRTSHPRS